MLTYITDEYEDLEALRGAVSITDHNFYVSQSDLLYGGAVIQNNLEDQILKDLIMTVVYYDEDDFVTGLGSQYIDYLFPGDTLGLSPYFNTPPEGADPSRYTAYIFPGDVVDDYELTENIFQVTGSELTGDFDDQVKVTFTNTYTKQVSEVDIYALVYDKDGIIIGGGSTYLDEPIPAGGTGEIEVYAFYDSDLTVSDIMVWVVPSYYTAFE